MRPTDQMLSRISAEIEEKQAFIDGVVEAAEQEGRDLTSQEMELVTRSRDRQGELNEQAKPMQEASRIALESAERIAQIGKLIERAEARSRRRSSTAPPAPTSTTTGRPRSGPRRRASGSTCTSGPPRTRRRPTTPACCRLRSCSR